MRSNNIKLHFLGYIVTRIDTQEYLNEILIKDELAIIAWSILYNDAILFDSKKDVARLINCLSIASNIQLEARQLFRFVDSSPDTESNRKYFKAITSKRKLISF